MNGIQTIKRYYRTKEIAEMFNVSPKTIQYWYDIGVFPQDATFKMAHTRFYVLEKIQEAINEAIAKEGE